MPLNRRFGEACTRWQVRPAPGDPIAFNDHTDHRWDDRVLQTLRSLDRSFRRVADQLAAALARFDGYADRYSAALATVDAGQESWVDAHDRDSLHMVWIQLHEDLLATLGIPRARTPEPSPRPRPAQHPWHGTGPAPMARYRPSNLWQGRGMAEPAAPAAPAEAAAPAATPGPPRLRRIAARIEIALLALSVVAFCVLATLTVWPTNSVTFHGRAAAGRDTPAVSIPVQFGSRRPDLSLSGPGEVRRYATSVDVRAVSTVGPVRPYFGTDADVVDLFDASTQDGADTRFGQFVTSSALTWAWQRTLVVALAAAVLFSRITNHSRYRATKSTHRLAVWTVFGGAAVVVWGSCLGSTYLATDPLRNGDVTIAQMFDYAHLRADPPPAGPQVGGIQLVVDGDSRAAVYDGNHALDPTQQDMACERSRDSLAALLELHVAAWGWQTRNDACTGAGAKVGMLTPLRRHGGWLPPGPQLEIPAQLGLLKQVTDLRTVVVMTGPNDVGWDRIIGLCLLSDCTSTIADPDVEKSFDDFTTSWRDTVDNLAALPTHPQVIVVGSYDLYPADPPPGCRQLHDPAGQVVVTSEEVRRLGALNDRLNDILETGAKAKHFDFLKPKLVPYCTTNTTGLGPDVVDPFAAAYRFHPTPVGAVKIAEQIAPMIKAPDPAPSDQPSSPTAVSSSVLPSSAVPSSAVPSSAVPSSAVAVP